MKVRRVKSRGPEIVIGMAAAGFLTLAGMCVYIRGCGNLIPVQAANVSTAAGHSGYRSHGHVLLPNPDVTPGVVGLTGKEQLCSKDFHTGTVRSVSRSTKYAACEEYGIDRAHCVGLQPDGSGYEIDHLVSLELGGTNDLENLWPQPYNPKPAAQGKDVLENWLHAQVCAGKMDLLTAQEAISADWYQAILTMQSSGRSWPRNPFLRKTGIRPDVGPEKRRTGKSPTSELKRYDTGLKTRN
jgi:hypothetical protein